MMENLLKILSSIILKMQSSTRDFFAKELKWRLKAMFRMLNFLCIHNNRYYWDKHLWCGVESDLEGQSSVLTERWWKRREIQAFVSAHNHVMIQLLGGRRSSSKFCVDYRLAAGSIVLAKMKSWVQWMPYLLPTANWFWPLRSNMQHFPHIP